MNKNLAREDGITVNSPRPGGLTGVGQRIDIDLLIVVITIQVADAALRIDIAAKPPVDWKQTLTLSFHNPSIVLTSPNILGTFLKVKLSYHDPSGVLSAAAQLTVFGQEFPEVGISVPVLPPYILGLLSSGAKFPQILEFAPRILASGLTFDTFARYEGIFRSAAASCGTNPQVVQDAMQRAPRLFDGIPAALPSDRGQLEKIQTLAPAVWRQAFRMVVLDGRIQKHFPGIEKKLSFDGADEMEGEESTLLPALVPETADAVSVIAAILGGIAAIAALGGTIVLAIAGLIAFILSMAVVLAFTVTVGWVVAVIVISVVGIVLLGVALVATVAAMIIGIIIAVRGSLQEIAAAYAGYAEGFPGRIALQSA